jgi:hypothetical protein
MSVRSHLNVGPQGRIWNKFNFSPTPSIRSRAPMRPVATDCGIIKKIKSWIKARNKCGKYIQLRTAWRAAKNIYHYHQPERFLSFLTIELKTSFAKWRLLQLPSWLLHKRFYAYVVAGRSKNYVIKLPCGNNAFSHELIQRLKLPGQFARYQTVLSSLQNDPWLRNHSVKVWNIRRHGGYSSEYVDGVNLAQYRDEFVTSEQLLSQQQHRSLVQAIVDLLSDLKGYHEEHGKLIGDWQLHNLIYSHESKTIVNVDAEGFFSYRGGRYESNLSFIEDNLRSLAELLILGDRPTKEAGAILDVFRALDAVRHSGEQYSAPVFVAGYHSLDVNGIRFRGQRVCAERLARVPYNFRNKRVLDLGCNVGGMLHALSGTIETGYGIDFNPHCINAAQLIKKVNQSDNLQFYTLNLDRREDVLLLPAFLHGEKVDICFLLSLCRWLENWRRLIHAAAEISESMLFESNGSAEEQREQVEVLHRYYGNVENVSESSTDDCTVSGRKLYLCTLRITSRVSPEFVRPSKSDHVAEDERELVGARYISSEAQSIIG